MWARAAGLLPTPNPHAPSLADRGWEMDFPMHDTHTPPSGVEALSRQANCSSARPASSSTPIAPPRFHWLTRIGLPSALALGFAFLLLASASDSLAPAIEVEAVAAVERAGGGRAAGSAIVQAAGWIEADPYLVHATALTDGVVESILVLEGDRVEAGQVVARLIPDDARLTLQRARAELARHESALAEARARLDAAQTTWDKPIERERALEVARARVEETRAAREQIKAQVRAAEADLERMRSDYDRIIPLGSSQVVAPAEVLAVKTRWQAQQAIVESLRRQHESVSAQLRREDAEALAARENRSLRTEERLELASARAAAARAEAQLEAARAMLAEAELRASRLEVRSPAAGIVVQRFKHPGAKVMLASEDPASAAIVSLYSPEKLQVRVDIALADAAQVAPGQKAEITADVLPGLRFQGTVTRVLHNADIQKNTLQAKVSIADPHPMLRPEMLARVKFLASPAANTGNDPSVPATTSLYVPRDALRAGRLWVVERFDGARGYARGRAIVPGGLEHEGWIEILEGLNPGDLVIPSPPATLKDGARLRVSLDRT